ncbi:MAG: aminopeptidase [Gammaproteobacteria bacterium]|nr:aminopeptidase [Gammaproteobacteria bacterium]
MLTEACRCPRLWLPAIALSLPLSGCHLLYLAAGQLEVNARRQPIPALLQRADTDAALRAGLEYTARAREFALTELALPDNGSFRSYADLGRPFATWNVFAAPEFSLAPRRWCWPIAGCVAYRGYFTEEHARRYAAGLARRGWDVQVAPALAWSTLGHFRDPVLNTMLGHGEPALAAMLFHELAHQRLWAPGENDFNEAFATVVEVEGLRRWLHQAGQPDELASWLAARASQQHETELLLATRARLERLYAEADEPSRLRTARTSEFTRLRRELESGRGAPVGVLNNAVLVAVATYDRCGPALEAELQELGGDLPAFYARLGDAAVRSRLCPDQRPARAR